MKKYIFPTALLLFIAGFALMGCDLDSGDSTTMVVSDQKGDIYDYSGHYTPTYPDAENDPAVLVKPKGRQSGRALTWMRLMQYGNKLEGFDSAGSNWRGNISTIQSGTANFTLQGRTSVGSNVEVAGTLRFTNKNSIMDAAWIEPGFSGTISAHAAVAGVVTEAPEWNDDDDKQNTIPTNQNGKVLFSPRDM